MEPIKVATIAIMAYVILGLAPLLESGQFVLPYTLFKPTFIIILTVGLILQKKRIQFSEVISFGWTIGLVLSSKFIFDIFWNRDLSESEIQFYFDLQSFTNLVTYIALLLWMLLVAWRENSKWSILQVIGAVGITICLLGTEQMLTWILVPTLIWYSGVFLQKNRKTVDYALAVFFTFMIVCTWLSAYFFGRNEVLFQL